MVMVHEFLPSFHHSNQQQRQQQCQLLIVINDNSTDYQRIKTKIYDSTFEESNDLKNIIIVTLEFITNNFYANIYY